jgi:glycosyltransferase involved in cell wall biosynthesis
MPRVSVVVPAHNAALYLREALASVEAQTYRDWEVVIADDCSTDSTVEIAESFGERFTVLRGARNEGPAAARNRALAKASGELVALLDADDFWLPAYLESTVRLFDESRSDGIPVGIVACDARLLGPNGVLPQTYMDLMGFSGGVTLERELVSNRIFIGALVPRAVLDEAGHFCPELFGTEDYDLWLRILELGYRVVATREVLTTYRMQPASVSAHMPRMARSLQLTYRRALERGRLSPRQQRIARRQLRLQRALEEVGLIMAERREGGLPFRRLARASPLFLRVAAENPDRWLTTMRILAGHGSPLSQMTR